MYAALFEAADQVDVLLHGVILRHPFELGPSVPFGTRHHLAKTRLDLCVVAAAALLVERIQLKQGGVIWPLREVFGVGNGLLESGFEVGHEIP